MTAQPKAEKGYHTTHNSVVNKRRKVRGEGRGEKKRKITAVKGEKKMRKEKKKVRKKSVEDTKISTGRKIDKTAFTRQTKIPRPKCTVLTTNIELDCGYWAQIWARWWRV